MDEDDEKQAIAIDGQKTVTQRDQCAVIVTPLQGSECDHIPVIDMNAHNIASTSSEHQSISIAQDVTSTCKLEMGEFVSVEVFDAANEIEINTDDTVAEDMILPGIHDQRDLPYTFGMRDPDVPDTIAAETVVTTSHPCRRKQKPSVLQHDVRIVSGNIGDTDGTDAGLWTSTIPPDALCLESPCPSSSSTSTHIVEVFASGDGRNFVTLSAPDNKNKDINFAINDNIKEETSIRDFTKRERDRLKKQALRTDPQFRQMEKDKSRARMRNKRTEPGYRDKERVKDKLRRRLARQRNTDQRQRERERDKHYKKAQRQLPMSARSSGNDDMTASYSIDLADIQDL